MKGYIHSVESFGTVDGPGVRFVVFMQGCPLRCAYCHNPDTWKIDAGKEVTAEQLLLEYDSNKEFYSKGGITVTGGEPLIQINFLIELFSKAKKKGIHTCVDTSGITYNEKNTEKIDELMKYCDLVLLDIKHIDTIKHKDLTGAPNDNILRFAQYLDNKNIPMWIRHVVVEGITDNRDDLFKLGKFVGHLRNAKALDVLPYHSLGADKYKELGIPYKLEGMKSLHKAEAIKAKAVILEGIKSVRKGCKKVDI